MRKPKLTASDWPISLANYNGAFGLESRLGKG